jgi:hypothetical protein
MTEIDFTVVRTDGQWAVRRGGRTIACADERTAVAEATRLAMAASDAGEPAAAIDDSAGEGRILWKADPMLADPHPIWGEGQHTDDAGGHDRHDHLAGQNPKSTEIPSAADLGRLRMVPPVGHEPATTRPLADVGRPTKPARE